MRIKNISTNPISFNDLDKGNTGDSKGIYQDWNAKISTTLPVGGTIDLFDTDRVMLSTGMGQIKKMKDLAKIETECSITGNVTESFDLDGTFIVQIGAGAPQSFTISGTGMGAEDVADIINATAVDFVAERSNHFFRSSFVDNIIDKSLQVGELGTSMSGARGESILEGFLVLTSAQKITIGGGTLNNKLGFIQGMTAQVK